ncbi:unnamed protein product [Pieris macdunnoughi]|uniref:Uncharacterized protein n=1 Tax=Pieris macdunnoughi TaxID=345717 RepID=A0A821PIW6_9NEOP|nr:unnamed protein product [Pieris macdunnoughi]
MSVIIRLQNLPWSANALDIRNYFQGLSIPEGGVHIVGGELGDAFIAFRQNMGGISLAIRFADERLFATATDPDISCRHLSPMKMRHNRQAQLQYFLVVAVVASRLS